MKVSVVMNASAGSIGSEQCKEKVQQVTDAFTAAGVEVEILLCEPARLTETARKAAAAGCDAVVAAGGDGTVSACATGLAGGQVPLAVLPLGTLNHFARDIGMPNDLGEAARIIAHGHMRRVDVAELNGRVFVNNSSIGLYPEMVMHRDVEQKQSGRGKWQAMLLAAWRVLRKFQLMTVRVSTPERTTMVRTPFVFVGNNAYSTTIVALGKRAALDQGQLGLYVLRSHGRLKMMWVVLQSLFGRAQAARELDVELITEVKVSGTRRRVTVALDGEVVRMTTPLHYVSRPGALGVLLPPPKEVTEPIAESVAEAEAEAETDADEPPRAVASYTGGR